LVATTIIEVGIDIPNATIMVIEDSEHFGLSQVYQLRGSVELGENESFCFLMTWFNITSKQREKIKAMVTHANGFKLSNMDLKFWKYVCKEQSGSIKLKIADLNKDTKIFKFTKKNRKHIANIRQISIIKRILNDNNNAFGSA